MSNYQWNQGQGQGQGTPFQSGSHSRRRSRLPQRRSQFPYQMYHHRTRRYLPPGRSQRVPWQYEIPPSIRAQSSTSSIQPFGSASPSTPPYRPRSPGPGFQSPRPGFITPPRAPRGPRGPFLFHQGSPGSPDYGKHPGAPGLRGVRPLQPGYIRPRILFPGSPGRAEWTGRGSRRNPRPPPRSSVTAVRPPRPVFQNKDEEELDELRREEYPWLYDGRMERIMVDRPANYGEPPSPHDRGRRRNRPEKRQSRMPPTQPSRSFRPRRSFQQQPWSRRQFRR